MRRLGRIGQGLVTTLLAATFGCGTLIPTSMLTNGEVELFRVRNGLLRGPWDGSTNEDGVIPARRGNTETSEESFKLTFDRGFLKYLSDFAGVNELVIVFTFEDGPIQKDEDRIVKILGPMLQQPDSALIPELSKICFGPTALQGRYLGVTIDVYEFDRDEANDTSALIDFIGSAAQTFAIADPVTAAEIQVAKEIGKVLAESNQNDLVLHTSFDLIPYEAAAWGRKDSVNPAALPLRTGNYGVIKTERPFDLFTFFPATRRLEFADAGCMTRIGNGLATPFAIAVDAVALPITALMRALTDVPDAASMAELQWKSGCLAENAMWYGGSRITFDEACRALRLEESGSAYRAKSWLTFSISRGHDAIPVATRGHLTESERKLAESVKTRSLRDLLEGSKLDEAIAELVKARDSARASRASTGFELVAPRLGFFDDQRVEANSTNLVKVTEVVVELTIPRKVEVTETALSAVKLPGGVTFTTVKGTPVSTLESARSVKFVSESGFPLGIYELVVHYKDEQGSTQLAKFPLASVRRPQLALSTDGNAIWKKGAKIQPLALTDGDFAQVRALVLEFKDIAHKSIRIENDPGSGDGITDQTIELTNDFGSDVELRSITLKRRGDLADVVVEKQ